ncbi:MAG: molybdate ABC transporter substrate-binding protein [Myxococcota bacterium]
MILLWFLGCQPMMASDQALHIFAASSLTDAFDAMAQRFESEHPGVDVALSFAGSQTLRLQIEQGAPADLFASANPEHIDVLHQDSVVSPPLSFAANPLAVIVPMHNPAGIQSFDDLDQAERLVIGADSVPVGAYTRQVLQASDPAFAQAVRERVVSEERNARLVRAKVEMGEADAAVVYRSDAVSSARVQTVAIPDAVNVQADYRIAIVEDAEQTQLAVEWVSALTSPGGQAILRRFGFVID